MISGCALGASLQMSGFVRPDQVREVTKVSAERRSPALPKVRDTAFDSAPVALTRARKYETLRIWLRACRPDICKLAPSAYPDRFFISVQLHTQILKFLERPAQTKECYERQNPPSDLISKLLCSLVQILVGVGLLYLFQILGKLRTRTHIQFCRRCNRNLRAQFKAQRKT